MDTGTLTNNANSYETSTISNPQLPHVTYKIRLVACGQTVPCFRAPGQRRSLHSASRESCTEECLEELLGRQHLLCCRYRLEKAPGPNFTSRNTEVYLCASLILVTEPVRPWKYLKSPPYFWLHLTFHSNEKNRVSNLSERLENSWERRERAEREQIIPL